MSRIMNTYNRSSLKPASGEGSWVTSENGEKYLDFTSGISVVNLGHSHPAVADAICRQARTLCHTSNLFQNPLQEALAERLSAASFGGVAFFCNSGAEANEGALKLARIYGNRKYDGKRFRVITMQNSFHGRTFATLSATGQSKIHDGFSPIADFITHLPYGDFAAVEAELAKGDVAAVMLELVQGEGGVEPVDAAYLKQLREICTAQDVLLIYDEIQTGMARLGELFGYQIYGIEPDVMTLAKALGNGVPIGCFLAREEVAQYMKPGTHGSTFGGNFLVCAAALATLDVMQADGFLQMVREKSEYTRKLLKEAFEPKGCSITGIGLMCGIRFPFDPKSFVPAALQQKLLLVGAGLSTVRFYPPLTASYEEIAEGVKRAVAAFDSIPQEERA